MYKLLAVAGASAIALLSNPAASAAPLLFTISGADNFSFTLASPSNPSGQYTGGLGFPALYFEGVIVQGAPEVVTFYGASNAGGFSVGSLPGDDEGMVLYDFIRGYGLQLYQGTISSPVFAIGSYPLLGGDPSTLVISAPEAAVPEIATWAMMMSGISAIGLAMRRQPRLRVSYT